MLGFPTPTPATGAASIRSSWDRVTTTPPDGGIRRNRARRRGPARRLSARRSRRSPPRAPTASPPPETPKPSEGAFVPAAYPPSGDAPCGEAKAPDAAHAAYRGNLKRIEAKDASTVVFELCAPDVAFLTKIASPAFAINDAGWLRSPRVPERGGDQPIVSQVNGTGPYRLESWDRGTEVSLGAQRRATRALRRQERAGDRALAAGTRPCGCRSSRAGRSTASTASIRPAFATVAGDVTLQAQPRGGRNVVYLGFSTDQPAARQREGPPGDRPRHRPRRGSSSDDFPPGAEVATHYTPCDVPFGCAGARWSGFDPTLGRETARRGRLPDGFTTTHLLQRRRHAVDAGPAGRVAVELQTELQRQPRHRRRSSSLMPDATFRRAVDDGTLDGLHLLDRGRRPIRMPRPTSTRVSVPAPDPSSGTPFADIVKALAAGRASANPEPSAKPPTPRPTTSSVSTSR